MTLQTVMLEYKNEEEYRDGFCEMKMLTRDTWQKRWGRNGSDGITKEYPMEKWISELERIQNEKHFVLKETINGDVIASEDIEDTELDP